MVNKVFDRAPMTKEEIYKWYTIGQDQIASGLYPLQYCRANNIDINKFDNMKHKFFSKKHLDPDYEKMEQICRSEELLSMSAAKYAKSSGIKLSKLNDWRIYFRYKDIVNEMKKLNGHRVTEEKMAFVKVPPKKMMSIVSEKTYLGELDEAQEVMDKQNDIEIIISKGVKVLISPNIDSTKIIKIIELLKDL